MKSIKRLKPLIKLESKPVLGVGICLMLANIFGFITLSKEMNKLWKSYLVGGIGQFGNVMGNGDLVGDLLSSEIVTIFIFYLIGIVFLSILSMRYNKSIETSRFLKSLPYTSGERSLVKVGLGALGFTVCFGFYSLIVMIMRSSYTVKLQEIYDVLPLSQIQHQFMSTADLARRLLVLYLTILVVYLFFILVQYIVSHKLGSTLIAICVLASPAFLLSSIQYCLPQLNIRTFSRAIEQLSALAIRGSRGTRVAVTERVNTYSFYFYTGNIEVYLIVFYLIVIGLIVLAIWKLSKCQLLEQADKLIPVKGLRWFFIAGVTLCGSFLICDLYLLLVEPLLQNSIRGDRWLALTIGAVISFIISKNIASIGQVKRKEVKSI